MKRFIKFLYSDLMIVIWSGSISILAMSGLLIASFFTKYESVSDHILLMSLVFFLFLVYPFIFGYSVRVISKPKSKQSLDQQTKDLINSFKTPEARRTALYYLEYLINADQMKGKL